MIKIKFSGNFDSMYRHLITRQPHLKSVVTQRIKWFSKKPIDIRLDNHALKRRMRGKWAFSITDDIRIVYEWRGKGSVRLLTIGPHHEVYRN